MQAANNICADQPVLICAFGVRICINRFSHDVAHILSEQTVKAVVGCAGLPEPSLSPM